MGLTATFLSAHLKETSGYCDRLEVAELEGDLLKALLAVNSEKLLRLYKKILHAKHALAEVGSDLVVFNYLWRGRNRNAYQSETVGTVLSILILRYCDQNSKNGLQSSPTH